MNDFEKGLYLLQRKIQWLADNNKIGDKMLDEWNRISELMVNGYDALERKLSEEQEKSFRLEFNYNKLHEDARKLVFICASSGINPDIALNISNETIKYYEENKDKMPANASTLIEADFFIKAIKDIEDDLMKLHEKEKEFTPLGYEVAMKYLEVMHLNFQMQLEKLT